MERVRSFQFDAWAVVISILVAGNGYFIKRLVDQLDDTRSQVYLLREEVASLKTILDVLRKK